MSCAFNVLRALARNGNQSINAKRSDNTDNSINALHVGPRLPAPSMIHVDLIVVGIVVCIPLMRWTVS